MHKLKGNNGVIVCYIVYTTIHPNKTQGRKNSSLHAYQTAVQHAYCIVGYMIPKILFCPPFFPNPHAKSYLEPDRRGPEPMGSDWFARIQKPQFHYIPLLHKIEFLRFAFLAQILSNDPPIFLLQFDSFSSRISNLVQLFQYSTPVQSYSRFLEQNRSENALFHLGTRRKCIGRLRMERNVMGMPNTTYLQLVRTSWNTF